MTVDSFLLSMRSSAAALKGALILTGLLLCLTHVLQLRMVASHTEHMPCVCRRQEGPIIACLCWPAISRLKL